MADSRSPFASAQARVSPLAEHLAELSAHSEANAAHNIWIQRLPPATSLAMTTAGEPLAGLTFAIKDNIDLAGVQTTAACPAFAYTPQTSATAVERLISAGATPLGKTNLDQFATGLVGTRSPFGACRNALFPERISGGSSAGSAVAVALGEADFSLGTDTAGSGRVPAAFHGLVGMKPSRGLIPNAGVVPACRSLDCVTTFTRSAIDAARLLDTMAGPDANDPSSRVVAPRWFAGPTRIGVPSVDALAFPDDAYGPAEFEAACSRLSSLGYEIVPIDPTPFIAAGNLLYSGPWVAERTHRGRGVHSQPARRHPRSHGGHHLGRRWPVSRRHLPGLRRPAGDCTGRESHPRIRRRHPHAHRGPLSNHRRGRGRTGCGEYGAWPLHQLHEPAGLCCRGFSGRPRHGWPALRRDLVRPGGQRSRLARGRITVRGQRLCRSAGLHPRGRRRTHVGAASELAVARARRPPRSSARERLRGIASSPCREDHQSDPPSSPKRTARTRSR